jgi:hypothetical protein
MMSDLETRVAQRLVGYRIGADGCTSQEAARAIIAMVQAESAVRVKPDRETFDAMCAMRNSINEHIPMPSIEGDLLQGPENSVFCATLAEAVIAEVTRLRAALEPAPAPSVGGAMTQAPERIWAGRWNHWNPEFHGKPFWADFKPAFSPLYDTVYKSWWDFVGEKVELKQTAHEYTRTDLAEAATLEAVRAALAAVDNILFMFSEPGVELDYGLEDERAAIRDLDPAQFIKPRQS